MNKGNDEGKYDDVCEKLCLELEAHAVLLIVLGGRQGNGFSVSVRADLPGALRPEALPEILEEVAWSIRSQLQSAPPGPDGAPDLKKYES